MPKTISLTAKVGEETVNFDIEVSSSFTEAVKKHGEGKMLSFAVAAEKQAGRNDAGGDLRKVDNEKTKRLKDLSKRLASTTGAERAAIVEEIVALQS